MKSSLASRLRLVGRTKAAVTATTRKPGAFALPKVVSLAVVLALMFPFPASASTTSWSCGNTACKYDQARVQYSGFGGGVYKDEQHHIWGSTASGTCDPGNDGIQWRLEKSELWVDAVRKFTWGPESTWHTNCQIDNVPPPPGWWSITVNKGYEVVGSAYGKHWIFHDHACSGCDFTSVIVNNLPSS